MLCENCGQNEATVLYTEITDGERHVRYLCEACAASCTGVESKHLAVVPGSIMAGFLSELIRKYQQSEEMDSQDMKKTNFVCPVCKTTYNEFLKYGILGCKDCYRTFGLILDPCLDEMQGAHTHVGEPPELLDVFVEIPELKPMQISHKDELEIQLKLAVEAEDFELAARLRDEIRTEEVVCDE